MISDSEDDRPLVQTKKSSAIVSKADRAKDSKSNHVKPGVSLPNGTNSMSAHVNGNGQKRKASLNKSYAAASDDDDVPLTKKQRTSTSKSRIESSDDEAPLVKSLEKKKASIEAVAAKQAKEIRANETKAKNKKKRATMSDDEDDAPLAKKSTPKAAAKRASGVKKEESDDDMPLSGAKKTKTSRASNGISATKTAVKSKTPKKEPTQEDVEAEEEEEEYRWWDDPNKGDGSTKWETLEHNGVVFPPPYEPLPKNVRMRYNGVPVSMSVEAEEVAGFYGAMLNSTVNVENPTFNKNFFNDFKEILEKTGQAKGAKGESVKIADFDKCDFKPIFEYYEAEREKKKAIPPAEKKANKASKDEIEAPYMFCKWDGRKQKVGNFRVEPPGLFRGRGEHPKTGKVKQRVMPEQVTINIGKEATVPKPPEGHNWKEVRHDNTTTWLAMWQENINLNYKYVMLGANSDIKGQSDHKKFEKARELKKHIDKIRKDYGKSLKSEVLADRQLAVAIYFIDRFALRAGNEKGEDEADTVGCCSLKMEHVTLEPPNHVIFDFLGKDSIRFYDKVEVDPQVFKNLRIFKKAPKKDGDDIFDRLTTSSLNKHLNSYMPGLTAKVFRTYNASFTFDRLMREIKKGGTVMEMVKQYNDVNREVAILCNHKRTVAAGFEGQVEKLEDRMNGVRYQQWRTKQMMLDLDPKQKKKLGAAYFELPSDMDKAWIAEHHAALVEQEEQKIQKKFAKDNEKLLAEGEKEMKASELTPRLEAAKELKKKLAHELKSGKVEAEGKGITQEKLEEKVKKLGERIHNMATQKDDKVGNKEVALGTSKINYIDPRLTVVFCKKFEVPIEKFFSKTLRDKFEWAMKSTPDNWEF